MHRMRTIPVSIAMLRSTTLLRGLSDEVLQPLARRTKAWEISADPERAIIWRDDTTTRDVYLIVSGRVRVGVCTSYDDQANKQIVFRDLAAGEHFGELSAIDGAARSADIYATENTVLVEISAAFFKQLIRDNPTVSDRVLSSLTQLIRDLSDRVFQLSTLGVRNRLDAEILRLAKIAGVECNTARIDPLPAQAEIASHISTSREQVSRDLKAMVRDGLVSHDGRELVVLDVDRLALEIEHAMRSNKRRGP